uniref:Uncharacterized protein n=1 Tax=Magallana gigas TaxID=29159 RepID=K1Q5F4_MAGGI
MGNFSVSALCDVCREVHTMHNMAVDSVDYTRVYTICEDKKLVLRRIENQHNADDNDCYRDSLTGHQSRDHWYFVGVGRDAGLQTTSLKGSKWESSILSPSCHNNCSDEVVEKHWKVK